MLCRAARIVLPRRNDRAASSSDTVQRYSRVIRRLRRRLAASWGRRPVTWMRGHWRWSRGASSVVPRCRAFSASGYCFGSSSRKDVQHATLRNSGCGLVGRGGLGRRALPATKMPATIRNPARNSGNSANNANGAASNDASAANQNSQSNADRSSQDRQRTDDAHHAILGVSLAESDGHVHVTAIMPGSPAAKAGLQVNDEIRAVDDQRIRTVEGLTEEIGQQQPGSTVELSIRRNGEPARFKPTWLASKSCTVMRTRGNRWYAASEENSNRNGAGDNWTRQNNWNRNRASSYEPDARGASSSVGQQLRQLQEQVAQLQAEVDELRGQSAAGSRVGYRNRSANSTRDSNSSNDNARESD